MEDARRHLIEAEKELAVEELPKRDHPATKKRGADPHVPKRKHLGHGKEQKLEQGLEESMAGSDPVSVTQPATPIAEDPDEGAPEKIRKIKSANRIEPVRFTPFCSTSQDRQRTCFPIPAGWNVAAVADFTGSGTDGVLWFNPTNPAPRRVGRAGRRVAGEHPRITNPS